MIYINQKKRFAAKLSITSNIILTTLKIFAGIFTGSLSIISEAIHSMSDFAASILTYFSVVKSSEPADKDHPFGHGKYEDMAGFIEGALIIFASCIIFYKACTQFIYGVNIESENNLSITVMTLAVVSNFIVSAYLFKIAKESNSISLYADGEHLRSDVYSSLGVLIGLIFIRFTGYTFFDPIIAILVAAYIYKTGFAISQKSLKRLLDFSLPNDDINKIENIINKFSDKPVKLKKNSIKARQIGPSTDIYLILQFPKETTLCECHQICDEIEKEIQKIFTNCLISIHSEPICYKKNCNKTCKCL